MTGIVEHTRLAARSSHLFHHASDFEILGGQYILGDIHNHHVNPGSAEKSLSFAEEEAFSDSEIYCGQMLRKKRGFPLYDPAPQVNLPAAYRAQGVSIGDVGSITSDGMFDFFFNIFLPADHPINGNRVPTGFSPMQSYKPIDISHFSYETGSHVSTASVQRGDLNTIKLDEEPGDDFVFHCGVSQGAVLALPHGAHLEKLRNVENIRLYAMKYGASWYEYVNGPQLGRGIENGELYVVTGCEKARSWGIASYHASREDFRLHFQRGTGAASNPFRWSGASGQKNPSQTKRYNPPPDDHQPLNHTTFVHGLSVSIGKGIWNRLFGTVSVECSSFAQYINSKGPSSSSSPSSTGSSFFGNFFGGGATSSQGRKHATGQEEVLLRNVPDDSRKVYNPSQLINEYILHKFPNATAVASHDEDWSDILAGTSQVEGPAVFLRLIGEQFVVVEKEGEGYNSVYRALLIPAIGAAFLRSNSVQSGSTRASMGLNLESKSGYTIRSESLTPSAGLDPPVGLARSSKTKELAPSGIAESSSQARLEVLT
ncbi:hypothetical protein R3P38DRAFT_2584302 [Favolaschia claudopus]|uniref:Uncharacterized protein n=1 Tax=Favolaschia claudopus TaxID=2862362 RepID=A0AAV9Z7L9_9AGAR